MHVSAAGRPTPHGVVCSPGWEGGAGERCWHRAPVVGRSLFCTELGSHQFSVCLKPRPHADHNSYFAELRVHRTAPCTQVTKLLVKAVRVRTCSLLTRLDPTGLDSAMTVCWTAFGSASMSLSCQPICSLPLVLAPAGSQVRHQGMLRTRRWSSLTCLCSFCFFLLWLSSTLPFLSASSILFSAQ